MIKKIFQLFVVIALFAAVSALADHFLSGALLAMAVVATPTTLSGMSATGLRKIMWDKKLREDSVLPSVFTVLEAAIRIANNEVNIEKAGVFWKVNGSPEEGQSARFAMAKPLKKAPQYGTSNNPLGNEDEKTLLWTELFYNEIKKAVKFKKYGYDYNDTAYLKFVESYGPSLIQFYQELRDTRIHQALLLRYAEELINAPFATTLYQTFNPNWIIPNLSDASLPAWDKDYPTRTNGAADSDSYYSNRTYSGGTSFAENVAVALLAASGTGSTPKNLLNIDTLFYISEYAPNELRIDPVMLDGIPSYVLLVPPRVKAWLLNPNKSGSLGEYFKSVADYKDPKRATIPGEVGRVCENLVIVADARYTTLTVGGSAGSYTLKPGFLNPGDNDDRNKTAWSNTSGSTNYVFDMCIGLGANAVAELLVDPLTTDLKESTNYGQIQGRGAYLGEGIQLPFWDKDAAGQLDGASKTLVYRGSFLVPVGRVDRVTVS